jgi:hypothetical protein
LHGGSGGQKSGITVDSNAGNHASINNPPEIDAFGIEVDLVFVALQQSNAAARRDQVEVLIPLEDGAGIFPDRRRR